MNCCLTAMMLLRRQVMSCADSMTSQACLDRHEFEANKLLFQINILTLVARFPDYSGFTYSVLWADPGPIRIPRLPCTSVFNLYFNRPIIITVTNNAKQILKSHLRIGNNQFHWLRGQSRKISDHMLRKWLTVNEFGDRKCFLEDFEAD